MAKHRAAASGGIQMLHKENRNEFRMVQLFKSHSESYLWQQTAATSTDQWSIEQKKDRKPYLYRFAICHLRCVLRKVEASRVLAFFMRDGLVSLMSPSACRQNNRSTASCANSWAELFWLHFLSFHSSCLCQKASKNFLDLGTPAPTSPCHACCTSLRDSLLPLQQRRKEGAAEDPRSWQRKEKHRAHFQVESLLLLTKTLQFSAELLSVFKSAPFISLCIFQIPRQANTNETFRNEGKRCGKSQSKHGKAVQLLLFNINILLKPG